MHALISGDEELYGEPKGLAHLFPKVWKTHDKALSIAATVDSNGLAVIVSATASAEAETVKTATTGAGSAYTLLGHPSADNRELQLVVPALSVVPGLCLIGSQERQALNGLVLLTRVATLH